MVPLLLFYLVTINALGFLIMLADKEKAKKRLWRIPEATLLTVAALGGSIGCLAGMKVFHHKTRKGLLQNTPMKETTSTIPKGLG